MENSIRSKSLLDRVIDSIMVPTLRLARDASHLYSWERQQAWWPADGGKHDTDQPRLSLLECQQAIKEIATAAGVSPIPVQFIEREGGNSQVKLSLLYDLSMLLHALPPTKLPTYTFPAHALTVKLSPAHQFLPVLLHEMAHVVNMQKGCHDGHGPLFAQTYINLLSRHLGLDYQGLVTSAAAARVSLPASEVSLPPSSSSPALPEQAVSL